MYYAVFKLSFCLLSIKFTSLNTVFCKPQPPGLNPASCRDRFYHVAADFDVLLSCKKLPSGCSLSLFGRLNVYSTVSLYGRELSHPECGRNCYFSYMSSCCHLFIFLELNSSALESEPAERAGTLRSNDATAMRMSLKKWICVFSVFIAIIPTQSLCQMKANPPGVEFSKYGKRNWISSSLVYVLHETRN